MQGANAKAERRFGGDCWSAPRRRSKVADELQRKQKGRREGERERAGGAGYG